jgi:tetratricopeptide (TPR) repeat protein
MKLTSRRVLAFAALAFAVSYVAGMADERAISSANALMEKRMYRDAIKVLDPAIEKQGDPESGVELRLAAESYYLLKDYGNARALFARALPHQKTQKGKMSCEARLAVLEYRLGDLKGAEERIDNFLRRYPTDDRVGMLTVVRIRIIQDSRATAAAKIKQIEDLYEQIAGDKERFGYYNFVLAAQALGDLYIESGNENKAIALYVKAVHEMRSLIASLRGDGKQVPKDLLQGADGMSLQIAKHYMGRKEYAEAQKWLENVSYDEELMSQAKYLLAQLAYQKREYGQVLYLLQDDLIARIADGDTKWGMCMLAGFAWRDSRMPDLEKSKEYLKKVPTNSLGYAQAQHGLADIYREQKDGEKAEKHYIESVKNAKYAPAALLYLGQIYKERADAMKPKLLQSPEEKKVSDALLNKAGSCFQQLMTAYPLTDMAKQARPLVEALRAQGIMVEEQTSEEDMVAAWEKTARDKPGSNEAAQALLSLAQHYARTVTDPKTKVITRAPNWKTVAAACDPIVKSAQPFTNVSPERWQELRARSYYYVGRAELGSLPAGASEKRLQSRNAMPVRMESGGSAARGLANLRQAQALTAEKQQPEFFRELEFAVIEAMFKSDDRAVRDEGEKRYAELETKYGSDPNYQRLAIVTADWLDDHGQFETAGRTYRNVARKANLERDEVMHLLHLAGASFGKAGRAMLESRNQAASLAFVVQPRAVIRSAASVFRSHPPFQFTKRISWDREGPDLSAGDAMIRVSREFGVPFVWQPGGAVAGLMKEKVIQRATLVSWRVPRTLETYYADIVGTNRFAADFDLGASGGTYTMAVKPEAGEEGRAIEIYDPSVPRFPTLAQPYGDFAEVHRGPAMLFSIVKHVEEVTGARVVWTEGVQKDEALSREFRSLPAVEPQHGAGCEGVLRAVLETVGLRCEVIRRDRSREMLLESNDCFDELRRFGADSTYAEDAMFNIAVNMYVLKEYGKMKVLLREYLKTFDNPSFAHYYDACFWLGRLFEQDKNYRDAVKYYNLAAEERVVVYRPVAGSAPPTIEDLKARLSYDTLFNLSRKASGAFKDARLEGAFLSFIRFNTNVDIALDPTAQGLETTITRGQFVNQPCLDLLQGVLVDLGLDLRTENGDKEVAEKAYYRIACVYKEDNLLHEALEYVQTMLTRFPDTARRVDGLKLKLDIHKGLRDYASVLATLEELRAAAKGKVEEFRIDYEMGRIYFDLCDYATAEQSFSRALSGTSDTEEWLKIRESLAITYLRMTNRWGDALSTYRNIVQYETSPVRQSVDAMMIWFLECATAAPPVRKPMPENEKLFIDAYVALTDKQRGEMDVNDLARVSWIYYGAGLVDLVVETNRADAVEKFTAAARSPDAFLAGEALYEAARIQMSQGTFRRARETFEHMMFITKAVEPTVKATYWLAMCHKASGDYDAAFRRFDEVVTRYPMSPYAALARENQLYKERKGLAVVPAAGTATTNAPPDGGVAAPATGVVAKAVAPRAAPAAGEGASLMAISDSGIQPAPSTAAGAPTNAASGARR